MNFGYRLKSIRKSLKLTLDDLEITTEVSKSFLSDLERGKKQPSLETLLKISKGLNMTVSELLGETPSEPLTSDLKEIIKILIQLQPDQKENLMKLIKSMQK